MKKDKSLANLSAKNRKEGILPSNLTLRSVSKDLPVLPLIEIEEKASLAPAAVLIKERLDEIKEGIKFDEDRDKSEEPKEIFESIEPPLPPLPEVDVNIASGDVKKVFYSVLNMFDTLYFVVMKNSNICSKKVEVERSCLLECQHYGYCKVRATIRELVKQL